MLFSLRFFENASSQVVAFIHYCDINIMADFHRRKLYVWFVMNFLNCFITANDLNEIFSGQYGISSNCGLDDVFSKNARTPVIVNGSCLLKPVYVPAEPDPANSNSDYFSSMHQAF